MFKRNISLQSRCVTFNSQLFYITTSLSCTIRYHLSLGQPKNALLNFVQWQKQGLTPDKFTIPSLLKLSSALGEPPLHGEQFHALALRLGHTSDIFVSTSLVEMYFKNGKWDASFQLFDEVPKKDVVLFTAMISGLGQNGLGHQALEFFSKMLADGEKPNKVTFATVLSTSSQLKQISLGKSLHGYSLKCGFMDKVDIIFQTSLLHMYANSGNIHHASKIFDEMSERNMVSWNIIMDAYFSNGLFGRALSLFKEMILAGWRCPRSSILTLVLQICGITTDIRMGKEVHGFMLKCIKGTLDPGSALECNSIIDMYIKAGDLESAILLFDRMPERNVVTWTTLILGYGIHGLTVEALEAFHEMKRSGISPDEVAFIAILSACNHGGLVKEGRELFYSMRRDHAIEPVMKHYVCMVDLYGRAGLLDEAFDFVKEMPVKPSKFIWGSLLSSCRKHKNLELGEQVVKRALVLDQFDVGNYALLSRMYADVGRWKDVAALRSIMKQFGIKENPAYSWVEDKGKVSRFTVNDCLNPSSRKMHQFLEKLTKMMKDCGFIPDISNVPHDISEEQKIIDLCGHTEKLALAFALVSFGCQRIIRVGKNLRVCIDCHEVFKFVSRVYNREIILKDPNRYHRFTQGYCSCRDFW